MPKIHEYNNQHFGNQVNLWILRGRGIDVFRWWDKKTHKIDKRLKEIGTVDLDEHGNPFINYGVAV